MFDKHDGRGIRRFAIGLALLSLMAVSATAWVLSNVRREQQIVDRLIQHLPESDLQVANELSGDLSLQGSLSVLLVLNIVATAIAFAMVIRGYMSSERTLEDMRVLSSDILASMDAGVITTDRNAVVTSTNPSARELLDLDGDGTGMKLSDFEQEHSLLDSICTEISTFHQPIRDRDYCVERNGHTRTLRAGCTMLHSRKNEQLGMVFHVRDVTQKALIEARLRRMERYMGLGSLAAGLQHEIKNPLSALSLHIQLLCERIGQENDDAEVDELLDILNTEVSRINNVLDNFRNYASVTALGKQPVDVALLIEKLARLLRPQAEQQGIAVELQMPKEMLGTIPADASRLEQVFLNLALNAIAAMPDGGTLRFEINPQGKRLRIDIIDTGNGIPDEVRAEIFDPYFTTRQDGTGMGLAICDKFIRQHDGSIDVQSDSNGTTFTVQLPMD
ncbi:PAS domain S-box-containing protein [Neorhodopirellula lusitana]|uniref:histidine kinase n=1 Tax=Neorhodopirellula lusitana TaxID=445327 RepID=A0ABY1Q284_9BACT|nr:ATP-binding protein [Neorhodopirellula lusitana]SMP56081.1 PAS domain S-box-containing protein [Neorhodopirellula lusitana]